MKMLRSKAARAAIIALLAAVASPHRAGAAPVDASATIDTDHPGAQIDRHIFGQFSEHIGKGVYGGIWVGPGSPIPNTAGYRNDVLAALRALHVPVLRWPGGCFADKYDWRDGVGPRAKRPSRVNSTWGGIAESNAFGTNEFMTFAEMIGADAYLAGNMGSEPPAQMAQWIEYVTADGHSTLADERRANGRAAPWKIGFFGIGNETWGCGGNMDPAYAADLTKRYSTFLAAPPASHMQRVASGPNVDDYSFTDTLMRKAARSFDALSLHYYTFVHDFDHKGQALGFGEDQWASTLKNAEHMDELVAKHSAIMDRYDPAKRVTLAVDEWGTWYDAAPGADPNLYMQQNSLRDALVAALTLNIFERHADRVRLATIAQMVNVDQSMILTDGARMVLTPTYHVFAMYTPFMGARTLPMRVESRSYAHGGVTMPAVDAVAARAADGVIRISLVNVDPAKPAQVTIALDGVRPRGAHGQVLTGAAMDAHNSFDRPDTIRPAAFSGAARDGRLVFTLPAKSVAVVAVD